MKSILVTGASGFIGRNVTNVLQKAGYQVRAQYRRAEPPEELVKAAESGVELVREDLVGLLKSDGYERLLDGIDAIVHIAAKVTTTGSWRLFREINIDVTRELLHQAEISGCRRFVYLSSMAVHGFGPHSYSSETGPYYKLISNYQKSKKASENIVIGYPGDTPSTVVLRPGLVYGPGDTTTLKPAMDLLSTGKMPMIGGFNVYSCHVYIDDFVQAVKLALEAEGVKREIFDIAGDDMVTLRDAIFTAAKLMGKDQPKTNIHPRVAAAAGFVLDSVYKVLRIQSEPLISRYLAQQLSYNFHFSPEKAKKMLGYAPRISWKEGLRKAVESYMLNNQKLLR